MSVPVAPIAPLSPTAIAPPPRTVQEEVQWARMSRDWKDSLNTLLNTIDTVNKNRYELERQKEIIRKALTQGKYDVLQRERALELYKQWNQGIQMIPLYPQDYQTMQQLQTDFLNNNTGESVKLYQLADNQPQITGYMYDVAPTQVVERRWIQVAPPDLFWQQQQFQFAPPAPINHAVTTIASPTAGPGASSVVIAPPQPDFPPEVLGPRYVATAIADWRVRPIADTETLSFDEAISFAVPQSTTVTTFSSSPSPLNAYALAAIEAVALAASNINTRNRFPPTNPNPGQQPSGIIFAPRIVPAQRISTVSYPVLPEAPRAPSFLPAFGPPIVGPYPNGDYVLPPVPSVPAWKALQQRRQIGSQFQRIHYPYEMPAVDPSTVLPDDY